MRIFKPRASARSVVLEEKSGEWWVTTTIESIERVHRFEFEGPARYFFVAEQICIVAQANSTEQI